MRSLITLYISDLFKPEVKEFHFQVLLPIIMAKAGEMNKNLDGDPNFKVSMGWLDKFKFRYGIRQLDISGEKLSANSAVVAEFKEQIKLKIQFDLKLVREQVYNCDETGLNWKYLSQKILASFS